MQEFPRKIEVLIVGAGPAGLTAAHWLNGKGIQVGIIDARYKAGHPVRCGEATRGNIFEDAKVSARPGWVRHQLSGGKNGIVLDRETMEYDWALSLKKRGVFFLQEAVATDISRVQLGTRKVKYTYKGKAGSVRARLVLAADGISSRIAYLLGMDTKYSLKNLIANYGQYITNMNLFDPQQLHYQYRVNKESTAMDFDFFSYSVFPTGVTEANVGVCGSALRGYALKYLLDQWKKKNNLFIGGKVIKEVAGFYPYRLPMETPYTDNVMVLGTAARLVNLEDGEGIYYAAMSGKAAAETYLDLRHQTLLAKRLAPYRQRMEPLYQEIFRNYHESKNRFHHQPELG